MAAIGLKVSFQKLFSSGKKGITFGLLLFTLQIAIAVIIAILILGLIHNSKIIKQDSAPFHLN